jgi:hypothetical protein
MVHPWIILLIMDAAMDCSAYNGCSIHEQISHNDGFIRKHGSKAFCI